MFQKMIAMLTGPEREAFKYELQIAIAVRKTEVNVIPVVEDICHQTDIIFANIYPQCLILLYKLMFSY